MLTSSLHLKQDSFLEEGKNLVYSIQPKVKYIPIYLDYAIKMKRYCDFNHIPFHRFNNVIPQYFPEELQSAVYEFSLACQAYEDTSNKTPLSAHEVFLGCFQGPSYAEHLKALRTKSFLTTISGEYYVSNSKIDSIKGYHLKDIGDIFNYKYLVNWEEPKSTDMQQYSFCDVPWDYSEEDLEEFAWHIRYELSRIPIEKIKRIPQAEVLLSSSSSTTYNGLPLCVDKQRNAYQNYMSSSIGDMKHFSLQKGPTENRDIVLLTPQDSNLVKWIDNQTLEIIQNHEWSVHVKDRYEFSRKFNKLSKKDFFFCRDIEKEGLTKPHKLLEIILEELYDYTNFDCYKNPLVFSNISVDGKKLVRGHGLGMANSITTLMQIGIHSLNISKLEKELKHPVDVRACFLNDDAAVGFSDREIRERFIEIDFETCENLKVCSKDSKSFKSNFGFVICEEYYHRGNEDFNRKDSIWRYVAMKPLNAVNIVHAKDIARSINTPAMYLDLYKIYYLEKWGYEFCPEEGNLPWIFGGWSSYNSGNCSFDLFVTEKSDIPYKKLYKLFKACRVSANIPKWLKKKAMCRYVKKTERDETRFFPLMESIGFPHLSKDEMEKAKLPGFYDIIEEAVQWRKEPLAYRQVWTSLMKRRQSAYKRAICRLSYEDTFIEVKDAYTNLDFMIPDGLVEGYEDIIESYVENRDIYSTEFKNLNKVSVATNSIIGFLYPNRLAIEREPKRYIPPDPYKNDAWLIESFTGSYWDPERVTMFQTGDESSRYYINPGEMISFAQHLGVVRGKMPINHNWEHPLNKIKESVFQRPLDIFEEILIHELEPMEKELIKQVTSTQEIDEDVVREFKECIDDIIYEPMRFKPQEPDIDPEDLLIDTEGQELIDLAIKETYETILQRFTWGSGISYGSWQESGGLKDITTFRYRPEFVLIPEVREGVKVLASKRAYNDWLKSTGKLGESFLEDDSSVESDFCGFDLDQLA